MFFVDKRERGGRKRERGWKWRGEKGERYLVIGRERDRESPSFLVLERERERVG